MQPLIVVIVVVLSAVMLFLIASPAISLQRQKRAAQREAYDLSGGKPVRAEDKLVRSYGRRSTGSAPQRGNGTLLCTDEAVVFVQWSPRTRLVIPREQIRAVQAPQAHNGKDAGTPLLCIVYDDISGEEESIAWLVRDRRKWAMTLAGTSRTATSPS